MSRTADVRIRVDDEEHELFRRAARLDGLSLAAWLRRIAHREAAKTMMVPRAATESRDE